MKFYALSFVLLFGFSYAIAQNALDFDGANDRVDVPNASALIAGNTISMAFWVRPTKTGGPFGFAGLRDNSAADFYILQLGSTSLEVRFRNSAGTNYDIVSSSLTLNTWQHFVMTYNGSLLALYKNGSLVSSRAASGNISSTNGTLFLGALPWSTSYFSLDGRLDDVSLWSKTLSASEVACMYDYGVDTSIAGLELYYSCDQGKAGKSNPGQNTLIDAMGNKNGTLNGFALSGSSSNWVSGVETHTYTQADICEGDSVLFGSVYRKADGDYFTNYALQNGCDSIVQLTLKVHAADTVSKKHRICMGDSVAFNGGYLKNEGTYMQTFTSRFGCDSTSIKTIDVDTVETGYTKGGMSLVAYAQNATFQWYNCDGDSIIPGETDRTFTFSDHASYAVIVTQNNCTDTSECLYTALGIENRYFNSLRVFPNPVDDILTIEGLDRQAQITIFDMTMKQIKEESLTADGQINLSDVKPGTYFLQIVSGQYSTMRKLLVK